MDAIKVEALVHDFLSGEALKILPQAPFGDAVTQFINKDDKHAMETFVIDALASQVKDLLAFDDDNLDLTEAMSKIKAMAEQQFAAGMRKQAQRRRLRDKPDDWDSDLDGHWADQDNAFEVEGSASYKEPCHRRRRALGELKTMMMAVRWRLTRSLTLPCESQRQSVVLQRKPLRPDRPKPPQLRKQQLPKSRQQEAAKRQLIRSSTPTRMM